MNTDPRILDGTKCGYCGGSTKYCDSSIVYGKSYGMIWFCVFCNAWVGVHKGTTIALGRVANRELREMKQKAHAYFDGLWQKKISQGFSKSEARTSAYNWLAKQIGIEHDQCHIGYFDLEQCKKVIEICKQFYTIKK